MGTTISNYSQFYKGTQQITPYGSGQGQKDTVVRYEFNTTDEKGNKVMDKMSREETFRTMNDISSQYGDNVIVEFSGDGLAAFEEHKGKIPLQEEPKKGIPEWMITHNEGPKPLTEEQLSEINTRRGDDMEALMKAYDSKAYEEMKKAEEESGASGTLEGKMAGFRYMAKWISEKAQTDPDWVDKAKGISEKSINKDAHIMTDFAGQFASRMPSVYGEKDKNGEYSRNYFSVSDAANNMLKAYASFYDEIIKGYEDGTRETYVEDKDSENGYRKLTKEEELAELDKAFKDYSERYAKNRDQGILNIISKHAEKVSRLSSGRARISGEAQQHIERLKKEMPADFTDRMVNASKSFVSQYTQMMGGKLDIASIL